LGLNKLDNFIKNTEGRILYVNPNDLDSTDSIENQGNSLARPFKTIQRALLEAARFSYIKGDNNDLVEKTTILLFPGEHLIDNRPGFAIYNNGGAKAVNRAGGESIASSVFSLGLDSNFDLTQENNILYKFNSFYGGVVVPRGTSIVGLDLRKTKIRPKYVPNPTDSLVSKSAIFRITGACYFWQFSLFDADSSGLVYTNPDNSGSIYQSTPNFSHHKLTCFEFCDGVNTIGSYGLTDLDMYYSKVSNAYNAYREIDQKYPSSPLGFAKKNSEWEIVGAFATDPISISTIVSGNGTVSSSIVTVTTTLPHGLNVGTPIKIKGVSFDAYNISTTVQNVLSSTSFTYFLPSVPLIPNPSGTATVTVEVDTVSGASPYIFNISLRSVWGMQGMHADGSKASGFRSMVVAQFTAVSLQKDDRAFTKYDKLSRSYQYVDYTTATGPDLPSGASQTDTNKVYHLDSDAIYRDGWETSHIKITNDAFLQIVSVFAIGFNKHFDAESGGDASITNSNSNFGQISLNSSGFKKEAFAKDNNAFITSIVAPRATDETEDKIEWLSLNVNLTATSGISSHLYLAGFTSPDIPPSSLTQGYRIGARVSDKLYFVGAGITYFANIYMCDNEISSSGLTTALGTTSSVKSYTVSSGPTSNSFTIGANKLLTGEKVKIVSDTGDLPENITAHETYYAITSTVNGTRTDGVTLTTSQIQLASSATNAIQGQAITLYGGTSLKILSRVSDKDSGDLGSPIQFDAQNSNWFIHVNENNQIYNALSAGGVAVYGETTDLAYINRISDERSLDEKLYKFRVVIPKELQNAKDPESGFVIQESSTTGGRDAADFTKTTITSSEYNYKKNPRFITTCSVASNTVTVLSELPHNLNLGDIVVVKNVKSSTNTAGTYNEGYNGRFAVTEITNTYTFKYSTTDVAGKVHSVGTFTDTTATRDENLPRFERNDWQSNLFVYRNEVISPYIYNKQDGIYHLYVLNAGNAITANQFTSLKYGQLPTDLYPQLDRDNIDANPPAAKTFAQRSPIGAVVTNDLKKSITRESTDIALKNIGVGLTISSVSDAGTSATLTFSRFHGLSGIVTYSTLTAGASYTTGTYYNVKLLNGGSNPSSATWNGATAKVVVTGGAVVSADIMAPGSGYSATDLYFDETRIGTGNGNARYNITAAGISTNIGDVVQITGDGTKTDGYYRITSVPSATTVVVAKSGGDPTISNTQYAFVVGPSVQITSSAYTTATGLTTFVTPSAHGLLAGNRFRVIDSSNGNLGDYLVKERLSVTSFTAVTNAALSASSGYILKHGLSSNEAISDKRAENLGVRNVSFYDSETFKLTSALTSGSTINIVSNGGTGTAQRLPLGSYIQIDNEIMRVLSSNNTSSATVARGALGTLQTNHDVDSLIRKISPIAIEFRRPSIVRASGHTFEYLGYGPGNYSTGLPQVQVKTLNDQENFLANSQERSGGVVVYTGMNNSGDFYNGNTKTSASSGEVISYDIPNPTVTGEDPNKLSVVFDEVTIKERLLVEGGASGAVLSQFDGPVTFNKEVRLKGQTTFSNKLRITNTSTDSVTINGGVSIDGATTIKGELTVNTGIVPDEDEGAYLGTAAKPFSDAHIGEIRIAQTDDNTIDTVTGNLKINATTGSKVAIQTSTTITGNLDLTTAGAGSDSTAGRISANYLDVPNISPVGSIMMWPGALDTWPTDSWRLCNGTALNPNNYFALYQIIGTTYGGSVSGSYPSFTGTFNLPNLLERFIVGAGGDNTIVDGTTGYPVGATGGENSVVLDVTQMPSHTHTVKAVKQGGSSVGGNGKIDSDAETLTTTPTGGGQPHENRPPYMALHYIIRVQ